MRLLVHIHLHYQEQAEYFIGNLQNITVPYDIIFTLTQDNDETKQKILAHIPQAKFLTVKNLGYDVYPFVQAMSLYDLDSYDLILKLHTKNSRTKSIAVNHIHYLNYEWRDDLIEPLIGSKEYFNNAISKFDSDEVGMVCSRNFIMKRESKENNHLTAWLFSEYGIEYNAEYPFCAGTMFMCRSVIIKRILSRHFTDDDFISKNNDITGSVGSLAHSMETFFGVICKEQGYTLTGVQSAVTKRKYLLNFPKALYHRDIRYMYF